MADFKTFAEKIKNSGQYSGNILFDESMKRRTTFRIGGKTPVLFEPSDSASVVYLLKNCKESGIRTFILGGGSNIVFCDEPFDGVVISTASLSGTRICTPTEIPESAETGDIFVRCGAGTPMAQFVSFCTENDLWGTEEFAGLPGSAGGALFMNARCFERSISDIFVSAEYIDLDTFEKKYIDANKYDWDYKISPFQDGKKFVLSAIFRLKKHSSEEHSVLVQKNRDFIQERKVKGHFKYPSAGSVFRNDHTIGKPSGKLIDECGLKSTRIGQAQIAPFHGNFIINLGGATQKDVKTLVEFVVNRVREKTGFTLQTEIIFVE
ncbi:MAG: UDP-N-acetylmuramate dehydrogenase [Treponema sp.]|nr:UDP-N-acetylmuramate dehydrogenase [Treponema sp.]